MKAIMGKRSRAQTRGNVHIPPLKQVPQRSERLREHHVCAGLRGRGASAFCAGGKDISSPLEGSLAHTKVTDAHAL